MLLVLQTTLQFPCLGYKQNIQQTDQANLHYLLARKIIKFRILVLQNIVTLFSRKSSIFIKNKIISKLSFSIQLQNYSTVKIQQLLLSHISVLTNLFLIFYKLQFLFHKKIYLKKYYKQKNFVLTKFQKSRLQAFFLFEPKLNQLTKFSRKINTNLSVFDIQTKLITSGLFYYTDHKNKTISSLYQLNANFEQNLYIAVHKNKTISSLYQLNANFEQNIYIAVLKQALKNLSDFITKSSFNLGQQSLIVQKIELQY
eukprot:TRINITY_DN27067_c0_g1_i7.p1 TRINITY_DN27067_c0_g1~~TRINITY_DN27067_c0_g1_i7.p1  ORF type:complete len:256 (+),score=-15.26 TRINITY_DN27067_c0_g1_i7:233-1000(+)